MCLQLLPLFIIEFSEPYLSGERNLFFVYFLKGLWRQSLQKLLRFPPLYHYNGLQQLVKFSAATSLNIFPRPFTGCAVVEGVFESFVSKSPEIFFFFFSSNSNAAAVHLVVSSTSQICPKFYHFKIVNQFPAEVAVFLSLSIFTKF